MLGLLLFLFGLMPFVLGLAAWHFLSRGDDSHSDDPPPPPPEPPSVGPHRPSRRLVRGPIPPPRTRVPRRFART